MEVTIVITILSFALMAAMSVFCAIMKDDVPPIIYYIGCIAIIPALIGLSILITEVRNREECKSKYELIQEPVYRKIKR